MEKEINKITNRLLSGLPQDQPVPLADLTDRGFPDFLADPIREIVNEEIDEQLVLSPGSWVNTRADYVQHTQQLFIDSLYDEAQLPPDEAARIIKTAVTQIVQLLAQPRKAIPELLFGPQDELMQAVLNKKLAQFTVYKPYKRVLTSYLERKEHTKLTKAQCQQIITEVDDKLTANYSPEQWSTLLKPLFSLTGDAIDSHLLYLFFDDKAMPKEAATFEHKDAQFSRSEFITILSTDRNEEREKTISVEDTVHEPQSVSSEATTSPNNRNSSTTVQSNHQEEPKTADRDTQKQQKPKKKSLNDIFATDQPVKKKAKNSYHPTKTTNTGTESDSSDKQSQTPLWKRFAGDSKKEDTNSANTSPADTPKPTQQQVIKANQERLAEQLRDRKDDFIQHIFNGSVERYTAGIHKIVKADDWDDAATIIQNDIFDKNEVDIYSPTAVSFIDRLQDYFDQH